MKNIKKLFKAILSPFLVEREESEPLKDELNYQELNLLTFFTKITKDNILPSLLTDEAVKIYSLEVYHPDFESLVKGATETEIKELKIISVEYFFSNVPNVNGYLYRVCNKIKKGNLTFRENRDLTTLVKMIQFYLGE